LPDRKTKKFALVPIFKNHLKKGLAINMFVLLLLVAAITVVNLAIAGTKVKDEYEEFLKIYYAWRDAGRPEGEYVRWRNVKGR
ncbi:MAG: hypothetical protein IKT29_01890, partial [Flavobacteriales bacterium]|nr:hypothetical protein [Flavobacteriales bacterium]